MRENHSVEIASGGPPRRNATYTVHAKDTLGSIARVKLGNAARWKEIAALNKDILPDPNRLPVGMTLELPPINPAQAPLPPPPVRGLFWPERFPGQAALTFDDGPHPVNTPKVLDILKRWGVKATFFVVGKKVRQFPELVRRIVAEGHSLGNHSDDHADFAKTERAEVVRQLAATQAAVDAALGRPYPMAQVRPPYGSMDSVVKEVLHAQGQLAVLWNVDSWDWRHRQDDTRILSSIFAVPGGVQSTGGAILFHDIHPQTVRVLGEVLTRLKRHKVSVVTTDVLLRQKYPDLRPPAVA
ncbi:MAG TPA: polysaccharide deacetylase family protein [Myxococcaceae bacterium]|nr:polysaccharide deacetylase family protein [Myxococcaceae bacterium]